MLSALRRKGIPGCLAEGQDFLAVQDQTADRIAGFIGGLENAAVAVRPHPGKWSIVEIVAHLADGELVASWRYRQMLEFPGCSLAGFDQDRWAAYGRYQEWPIEDALATFRLLRRANLRMLRALPPGPGPVGECTPNAAPSLWSSWPGIWPRTT